MEDKAFSSIDFVGQCLIDEKRSLAFEKAIKKEIKKGDTVLDVGTGSGIMSLFAARKGAGSVTAVEFDPFIASIARINIKANDFQDKITVVEADARNVDYQTKKPFDMVIMEMLTTGMVDEFQVQAVNNLHRQNLIDEKTKLIPFRQDTFGTLGFLNYKRYGFNLPTIRHLWKFHHPKDVAFKNISKTSLLHSIDFKNKIKESFSEDISFIIQKTSKVNSIRFSSISHLSTIHRLGDTESINADVSIPIEEIRVKKGDKLVFNISYNFGHGYGSLKIKRII